MGSSGWFFSLQITPGRLPWRPLGPPVRPAEPPCSPADTPNTPPRDQQTSPRQFQTSSTHFVRLLQIDGKRIEKRDLFSQPFSKCIGAWTRRGRISSLRRSFDLKVASLSTGHLFSFWVLWVSGGHPPRPETHFQRSPEPQPRPGPLLGPPVTLTEPPCSPSDTPNTPPK